jgi:hypothetical protein
MASGWPNLAAVRTVLRLQPDPTEDTVIGNALAAAMDYGMQRTASRVVTTNADGTVTVTYATPYPADTAALPDAIYDACTKHACALYRRRDSIDGTVGWGDLGVVRLSARDPDIERGYALYSPVVFG